MTAMTAMTAMAAMAATACSEEINGSLDIAADGLPDDASAFERFRSGPRDHGSGTPTVRRAIDAAAARLAALQADAIGDNARNGLDDSDPDDGGWDFIIAPSATQHTTAASPPNLFGAIGLAAWAAVESESAGTRALVVALDAGTGMQRNPEIDSPPDFVFGPLLAELADNPGFAELARQRYDARLAAAGGAAGLGALIRDDRDASNQDGLIPYDLGWLILGAAALDAAFPDAGYDRDADTYAGIVVEDLTAASPRFDLRDPTEEFYITGLAWSQVASSWLRDSALFRQARALLLEQQHDTGAWGANAAQPADDLQATAHALQALAITGQSHMTRRAIRRAARWLLDQQAPSGGWPDAAGNELPLVNADIVLGLVLSRLGVDPDFLLVRSSSPAAPSPTVTSRSRAAPLP
jgi:hypothetical protein